MCVKFDYSMQKKKNFCYTLLFRQLTILRVRRRYCHRHRRLFSEHGDRRIRGLREEGDDFAFFETRIAADTTQQRELRQRGHRFRFLLAGTSRFSDFHAESQGLAGAKALRHQHHPHHQTAHPHALDFLSTGKERRVRRC